MTQTSYRHTTSIILLAGLLGAALIALLMLAPTASAATTPEDLSAGNLIRGESFSAVYYYAEDGFRYVFPNDKTYFTWYDNFDDVKWLSDSDLATLQIGGNVTYKPGVKMVKITSDSTVYAIASNGTLRAIDSEQVAEELYGSNWNQQIDDIPDGFFSNYTIGSKLEFASQFDVDVEQQDASSIDDDKGLRPATQIELTSSSAPMTTTIDAGTAVRFTNTGNDNIAIAEWDRTWGSGTLEPGEHYSRYFTQEGIWTYYDKLRDQEEFTSSLIVE